jgi:hypothetical protein
MPAAQTEVAAAIYTAITLAIADEETVVATRAILHPDGHIVVWLDLEAGARARLAVWDGSNLVSPLNINRTMKTRANLRALPVAKAGTLIQDWTAVAA